MEDIDAALKEYNMLFNSMDEVYGRLARKFSMTDSVMWVMYALRTNDGVITQKSICDAWCFSKQTINSALHGMERDGYIEMKPVPGDRRSKQIILTAGGMELAERTIMPMIRVEEAALAGLDEQERALYLKLMRKHAEIFRAQAAVVLDGEKDR